jgi:ribosomal protein S18 acetylase RimI-like enzyme
VTEIRVLRDDDRAWIRAFLTERWGEQVVVHGTCYLPGELPGFVAIEEAAPVGLATYRTDDDACELVTLDSLREGRGIGSALVGAVIEQARLSACRRVWLVTTNDNLGALRFYQRRGFWLAALRPGAVDQARRLKPSIPLTGEHQIPIRDELELELHL